jgi:arsenate reductase
MAEGLLRALAGDRFDSLSAGTDPRPEIHPMAARAMAQRGLRLEGQRPKHVSDLVGRVAVDHVITVCGGAQASCPTTFPGAKTREFWDLADPAAATGTPEEQFEQFRKTRDEIEKRIVEWLKRT